MIYNELQETVLSLLATHTDPPEDSLKPVFEAHGDEPDLYSRLIAALMNVELEETVARSRFADLLEHHRQLQAQTGRRMDLRVAAMDYLLLHPEIVETPTIVDQSLLQLTRRLAAVDGLTGLFNRRFLETYLSKEVNRALRYEQAFSVLFLDLDDFKKINDTHGHATGDRVLMGVAKQIMQLLRGEDIAARYGGEEFVVVLPQTTADGAQVFGERLREAMTKIDLVPGCKVTTSGGVAAYPRHGLTVESVLGRADEALYEAKAAGKDRIVMSHADKRASRRYEADIPAIVFAGDSELGPLRLRDVSEDGCSLVCSDRLRPGEVVRVRVLTDNDEEKREYDVLARVVWSRPISRSGPYRIGSLWDKPGRSAVAEIVKSASARLAS